MEKKVSLVVLVFLLFGYSMCVCLLRSFGFLGVGGGGGGMLGITFLLFFGGWGCGRWGSWPMHVGSIYIYIHTHVIYIYNWLQPPKYPKKQGTKKNKENTQKTRIQNKKNQGKIDQKTRKKKTRKGRTGKRCHHQGAAQGGVIKGGVCKRKRTRTNADIQCLALGPFCDSYTARFFPSEKPTGP